MTIEDRIISFYYNFFGIFHSFILRITFLFCSFSDYPSCHMGILNLKSLSLNLHTRQNTNVSRASFVIDEQINKSRLQDE